MSDQQARIKCRCDDLAMIRIGDLPLCRRCCEQIRREACRLAGRQFKASSRRTIFEKIDARAYGEVILPGGPRRPYNRDTKAAMYAESGYQDL
jgi:hypothetical protein